MSFRRVSSEIHMSTDGRYALIRYELSWYVLRRDGENWIPVRDKHGNLPLGSMGDARDRVQADRWGVLEKTT